MPSSVLKTSKVPTSKLSNAILLTRLRDCSIKLNDWTNVLNTEQGDPLVSLDI